MGKHLTTRDRVILQYQIEHNHHASLQSCAADLKCSESTIYREIKRNAISLGSKKRRFMKDNPVVCTKLKSFPYVCNTCTHKGRCSKEIIDYDAYEADKKTRRLIRDARSHPRISLKELKQLDQLVSERVMNHQSLYHILLSDKRITVSESTLRRYIDKQYLQCRNIDLPRTVRFPHPKTSSRVARKRINIECLVHRTYQDFQDYTHSSSKVMLQLDTVIGKLADKKCLLTCFEPLSKFQWGYLVYKSSASVNHILKTLIDTLYHSNRLFFDCLLTDNGSEFQSLPLLETTDQGEIVTRIFYCDPYASFQKGACERNHSLIRYVIKKGESFDFITQDQINELFSHINSQKRKSLAGKTPFQAFFERFHFHPSEFIPVFEVTPSKIKLNK
jgi:IS30 family transposase